MRRKILDTSRLLAHWHDRRGRTPLRALTVADTETWGRELIQLRRADAIVTPIYLEAVCGVTSAHELHLMRAYLGVFRLADEGEVLPQDWVEARRRAERVPRDGRKRQLGDCLIRAIAPRLKYDVDTKDAQFPA